MSNWDNCVRLIHFGEMYVDRYVEHFGTCITRGFQYPGYQTMRTRGSMVGGVLGVIPGPFQKQPSPPIHNSELPKLWRCCKQHQVHPQSCRLIQFGIDCLSMVSIKKYGQGNLSYVLYMYMHTIIFQFKKNE